MRYPKFLKPGGTIGIPAPSLGCTIEPYLSRTANAIKTFAQMGYKIKTSPNSYTNKYLQSASKESRAKYLMEMYLDDSVDFLISQSGGERMIELLPYLDFNTLAEAEPKFFMGFSDNTNFTFYLTTICDIASIYAPNFPDFGMAKWDEPMLNCFNFISGQYHFQHNYNLFEVKDLKREPGMALCSFNMTEKVVIENITGEDEIKMEGRLLGGCLDCLPLCLGTPFDTVLEFCHRYQQDGLIWYLEACELNPLDVLRILWQLKNAGWFETAKGFIFGRPLLSAPVEDVTHQYAILEILKDLNVPIIFGADIGHVPPVMTIINGAYAKVQSKDGNLALETILK